MRHTFFPDITSSSEKRQIDRAVRQAAEENNVIRESVLRDGGKVFLNVRLLDLKGSAATSLNMHLSKAAQTGR